MDEGGKGSKKEEVRPEPSTSEPKGNTSRRRLYESVDLTVRRGDGDRTLGRREDNINPVRLHAAMPPSQRAAVLQLHQQCPDYRCQQPGLLVSTTETLSQQTQQPPNLSVFEPEVGTLGSLRRKRKYYTRDGERVLKGVLAETMDPEPATCDELAA
ncbi:unnamed protein product [Taenia asiatica]|uniref:Uncharacterized protein n=1 Tax=Taenia asiatica TaxID=60517 RepID=A0A0R3WG13_TAEAS|nr:unnamed protein product [Taenia asiatica]